MNEDGEAEWESGDNRSFKVRAAPAGHTRLPHSKYMLMLVDWRHDGAPSQLGLLCSRGGCVHSCVPCLGGRRARWLVHAWRQAAAVATGALRVCYLQLSVGLALAASTSAWELHAPQCRSMHVSVCAICTSVWGWLWLHSNIAVLPAPQPGCPGSLHPPGWGWHPCQQRLIGLCCSTLPLQSWQQLRTRCALAGGPSDISPPRARGGRARSTGHAQG